MHEAGQPSSPVDGVSPSEARRTPDSPAIDELPIPPSRLLEESPNGWLLADSDGEIKFANARASELFGYTRDELLGIRIERLVPDRLREAHVHHRTQYMSEPIMRPMGLGMELTARRKDGSEFPVEISLSPMPTPQGVYVTAIVRDIRDRILLEEERNSLRLELEMERERDRIGMDLHDGIMQEIYAVGLTLDLAIADVRERPDAAESEIERSIEQLHAVIRNIRSYIFDLRPRQYSGSLAGALSELGREFRQNTQIEVIEEIEDLDRPVATEIATAVYHIVHEALSNVRKHAMATQVLLSVHAQGDQAIIEVRDNGDGFDTSLEHPQVHRGLRNMATRARNSGCDIAVRSATGQGTCIRVTIPLEP